MQREKANFYSELESMKKVEKEFVEDEVVNMNDNQIKIGGNDTSKNIDDGIKMEDKVIEESSKNQNDELILRNSMSQQEYMFQTNKSMNNKLSELQQKAVNNLHTFILLTKNPLTLILVNAKKRSNDILLRSAGY